MNFIFSSSGSFKGSYAVLRYAFALLLVFVFSHTVTAQDLQDTRMVGIGAFASNTYGDSVAAKNINAAISRILVQTKRFTVLEIDMWRKTQSEIERQKDGAFLERDIIEEGKSLGAQILILGFVKNAEIYSDAGKYAARVDYELKYVDVETGKSLAAEAFTGDSENLASLSAKGEKALRRIIPTVWSSNGKAKTLTLTSAALGALSETDKNAVNGKIIDAIEESVERANTWIRNTFGFSIFYLRTLEEDKKNGATLVLIEGGEDIGMEAGMRLKMVMVTEYETSKGIIRDEEPIAELAVEEVRTQTSKCRVIGNGNKILDELDNKNMRIIFD